MEPAGVTRARAVERAARVSNVATALTLSIPTPPADRLTGTLTTRFRLADASTPLVLDFAPDHDAPITCVVNGHPRDVLAVNGHLVVPSHALATGPNQITIDFTAGGEGLHRSDDLLYSLFVPARASHVLPCFDQPDLKVRWALTLDVPHGWRAVSNSRETRRQHRSTHDRISFAETPPISTYLFAFAAGRFRECVDERGDLALRIVHQESDDVRFERNRAAILDMHRRAVAWLEAYTDVPCPFTPIDVVLIPSFPFGGMEHPGAIGYNADLLLLDDSATPDQHLRRAHVIAHEVAHLWFGDLVTMTWFDDVWLKEVLANVMASKILAAWHPDEPHALRFLLQHFPAAYDVDRSEGANPIRQPLDNLDDAGALYGPVIYLKAPIVFRDLEQRMGETAFRDALREYLARYHHANADWPALLAILSRHTSHDLDRWSRTWIDQPGRPVLHANADDVDGSMLLPGDHLTYGEVVIDGAQQSRLAASAHALADPVARARAFMALWDAMLGHRLAPPRLFDTLLTALAVESEDLTRQLLLDQAKETFWRFTSPADKGPAAARLETILRKGLRTAGAAGRKATWFASLRTIALTGATIEWLEAIWRRSRGIDGLLLSDLDETALALDLAVRLPAKADEIVAVQIMRTGDPERRARLAFIAPAVSPDPDRRATFVRGLEDPRQRTREPWVIDALRYLHHPLRADDSARFVRPALDLVREIQRTGDIFFPKRWTEATLSGHQAPAVATDVRRFLDGLAPDYPTRLKNLVLVAADPLFRAADWLSR